MGTYQNRIAATLEEIGENLKTIFKDQPIPKYAIDKELKLKGYSLGSILASDYCYNLINKASYSCVYPLFEWVKKGNYYYLGPNYKYNGDIYWKPKGSKIQKVGFWKDGICNLSFDPRKNR